MGSKVWELLNGTGAQAAKSVTGYCTTAKEMVNNFAGAVGDDMQAVVNAGKVQLAGAREHAGRTLNSLSQQSVGSLAQSGRQAAQDVSDYMVNTSFGQMASDAKGAITNDMAYKVAAQKAEQARNYGKTLLGDIDQFYHNADGSYNRTKVGATIGAGLGIAGIAGYNMNN